MANDQHRGPVAWSRADEATLVHKLAEEKAKGNWNVNRPKRATWTACALALVNSERKSGGSAKTIQSIKNRWQRLKQEFKTVKALREVPGIIWNDQEKTLTALAGVWDEYVKTHPYANKFRMKPFPLYNTIAELVNDTLATGGNSLQSGQYAFRAGQHFPFDLDRPSSPSLDSQNYSSSEDDELASQTFSKRSKSGGTSASRYQKMRHVSLGPRLSEMAVAVRQMAYGIRSSESTKSSIEALLRKAITVLEQDGGLSDDEIVEAACYFEEDPDRANAYISLTTAQKRCRFLRYELESQRKNV